MTDFNINELIHLADNDPENFEQQRQKLIALFIDSFPSGLHKDYLLTVQKVIDEKLIAQKNKPLTEIDFPFFK